MSGLSLAVGPIEGQPFATVDTEQSPKGLMSSIRTIELQLVAFIVVFSASGLVPVADLLFPVFATAYVYILSIFVFPSDPKEGTRLEVFRGSRMFQLYVVVGTVIGLFLPLAYVLGGFARGDQRAVRASTPHLFLLSVQVLSENIVNNLAICSPPSRAFLTAIYTGRRLFSLADWIEDAFIVAAVPDEPRFRDFAWTWFGRGLATANFVYFTINMFCFIIPRYIPRAFQRYHDAHGSSPPVMRPTSHEKPKTVPAPKDEREKKKE